MNFTVLHYDWVHLYLCVFTRKEWAEGLCKGAALWQSFLLLPTTRARPEAERRRATRLLSSVRAAPVGSGADGVSTVQLKGAQNPRLRFEGLGLGFRV